MKRIYKTYSLSISGLTLVLMSCLPFLTLAQQEGVAINITGDAADPSAMLDIVSKTRGLLTPRMSSAERIAIVDPADGLLVYDETTACFYYYNVNTWIKIGKAADIIANSNNISLNTSNISINTNDISSSTTNITTNTANILTNTNNISTNTTNIATNTNNISTNTSIITTNTHDINNLNTLVANKWDLAGNSGTNASLDFLGTTDAQDLVTKTNSQERMRITSSGNTGIGTNAPTATLHLKNALGYNLLRLESSYVPTSQNDPNGQAGDITWGKIGPNYYMFLKTPGGWVRSKFNKW